MRLVVAAVGLATVAQLGLLAWSPSSAPPGLAALLVAISWAVVVGLAAVARSEPPVERRPGDAGHQAGGPPEPPGSTGSPESPLPPESPVPPDRSDAPVALTAADERASIAADLHDWMGQGLTGVGLWLDRLRVQAAPELGAELWAVRAAVDEVAAGARARVRRLRASVLGERSLAQAIVALARHIEATGGPEVVVRVPPPERRLHPAVEDQLWCVVLEAVANARRHSVPTRLTITWDLDGPRSRLVVQNDGPRALPADLAGVGLRGMHDRARRIGASLWAGPVDDGWCVQVEGARWAPPAPLAPVEPANGR